MNSSMPTCPLYGVHSVVDASSNSGMCAQYPLVGVYGYAMKSYNYPNVFAAGIAGVARIYGGIAVYGGINSTGTLPTSMPSGCYAGYFDGGSINGTITGKGARGLKAKKTTSATDTVLNGGYSYWNGTNVTLSATGGTYTADASKCMGIRSDNNMTVTAGTIAITTSNSSTGISVKGTYKQTGGTVTVDGKAFTN